MEYNAMNGIRKNSLNMFVKETHDANKRWWRDLATNKQIERNVGELLMLTVSELSEAMEGHRKNLMDDKLPHRRMFEVELADAIIRIFDLAGGLNLDLGGAYVEKMEYNASREDHTREARMKDNGKKY
jgi:NTP pyrophosphatase (non-canonical NTP hydrolase)